MSVKLTSANSLLVTNYHYECQMFHSRLRCFCKIRQNTKYHPQQRLFTARAIKYVYKASNATYQDSFPLSTTYKNVLV